MALSLKKRNLKVAGSTEENATDAKGTDAVTQLQTQDESPQQNSIEPTHQSEPLEEGIANKKIQTLHRLNLLYQENNIDIEKLMQKLLVLVVENMDAQGGSLWVYNKEKNNVTCKAATGPGSEGVLNVSIQSGKGIVGWVAEHHKPTISNDTGQDRRFSSKTDNQTHHTTQSILASPLICRGELVGVIEIVNKTKGEAEFNEQDQNFLFDICVPAAMHIMSSIVMKRQDDLIRKLDVLHGLQELFGSTMEYEKLVNLVLQKAVELLETVAASVWLLDEAAENVVCLTAEGPTKDKVIKLAVKKGDGIVGWVVENKQSSLVEDCSKDPRFLASLDEKTKFVTESMVCVPLTAKGECIGAIQLINKRTKGQLFSQDDLEFAEVFAANAAMFIKNASLYASEKKAKELSALITISKEITATLDINAVLMSIVNLSADVIPYDQAAISLFHPIEQKFIVKAIKGLESVDQDLPETQSLNRIHNLVAQGKGEVTINSLKEYTDTAEFQSPEMNGYFNSQNLQSFWAYALKDDQGIVGVLTMQSKKINMISANKKELLSLLVSQCTVALRNAELYTTIPNAKVFESLKSGLLKKFLMFRQWPIRKQWHFVAAVAVVLLSLVFLKVPYHVSANLEVVPVSTTYYSEANGIIGSISVNEGARVKAGDLLMQLNVSDLIIQKASKESTRSKVKSEMIKLLVEENIAEFKIKENEKISMDYEIERLTLQIKNAEVRAQHPGVVVTEKLGELLGKPVSYGDELIRIARSDAIYIEFEVPEEEVVNIQPDQEVKFKVYGLPGVSFYKGLKLASVGGEGVQLNEADKNKYFIARAQVKNVEKTQLRPGMTGRGQIYADKQSLGFVIFNKPFRFLSMKFF
ncbi:MAG: GAF domain-containing protein [Oligoflexia bacterium]|nr:GAF domain-containing protein [Oligoflexia bacterium]